MYLGWFFMFTLCISYIFYFWDIHSKKVFLLSSCSKNVKCQNWWTVPLRITIYNIVNGLTLWPDEGVNSTAQGFSIKDWITDDSYFNISELKLSITSLYIVSDAPKYDIIWTESSDVIDSFISEILKYKSSVTSEKPYYSHRDEISSRWPISF